MMVAKGYYFQAVCAVFLSALVVLAQAQSDFDIVATVNETSSLNKSQVPPISRAPAVLTLAQSDIHIVATVNESSPLNKRRISSVSTTPSPILVDQSAIDEDNDVAQHLYIVQEDLLELCALSAEIPTSHRLWERTLDTEKIDTFFTLDHFDKIDDVDEVLSVSGVLVFQWTITCYSREMYKLAKRFTVGPDARMFMRDYTDFFRPRIRLRNSVQDSGMIDGFNMYMQAYLTAAEAPNKTNIMFKWTRYGTFETKCPLSLNDFPFDEQHCELQLASHSSFINMTTVDMTLGFLGSVIVTENSGWDLTGKGTQVYPSPTLAIPSQAVYWFNFKRRPNYYVNNMLLPCFILTCLQLFAFLFPPESIDRCIFSITVVLALVFMLSLVLGYIPKVPQRIFLSDYILLEALLCTICTLQSTILCWFVRSFPEKAAAKKPFVCCNYVRSFPVHRIIDKITFAVVFTSFVLLNAYALKLAFD